MILELSTVNYLYKIRMDSSHGNGYDTLYRNNYTTIASTFYFQENTFLTLEVTTDNANFGTFRQIQFIRLEV